MPEVNLTKPLCSMSDDEIAQALRQIREQSPADMRLGHNAALIQRLNSEQEGRLREYITKAIGDCERSIKRYSEYAESDNAELRIGGASFQKKHEKDLVILKLALEAIDARAAKKDAG